MLLDPLDSEGSSGSRSRKIFIPADDLKAEGIIAGDLVRVSVQGSQQVRRALVRRPSLQLTLRLGWIAARRRTFSCRPGRQARYRAKVRKRSSG